jgi:thiol-disulfide isomerase/thioredoxin
VLLTVIVAIALIAAACGSDDTATAAGRDSPGGEDESGLTITPDDPDATPDVGAEDTSDDPPAPRIEFTYFDGTAGTLEDFAGKPLVVNFFASWCPPCVAEMPDFQAIFEEVGAEVPFLGFNVLDDPADADALVERTGVRYAVARDDTQGIFQAFRGFAMPTTVLIDADGTIATRWAGPLSADQLRELIAQEFGV